MLKSNLFYYNDAFILVSGDIISIRRRNLPTEVACNNCPSFIKCITKIDRTTIDHADN